MVATTSSRPSILTGTMQADPEKFRDRGIQFHGRWRQGSILERVEREIEIVAQHRQQIVFR